MSTRTSAKVANLLAKNLKRSETYKAPPLLRQGIMKNKEEGKTGTTIISCSDPRIPPELYLDLSFSEAAIIRNAGGRVQDAMRSILALDTVGRMGTLIVVHHTDCGMSHFDEARFEEETRKRHPGVVEYRRGRGEVYGAVDDPRKTIVQDVEYLKTFPSLTENMEIVGLVLDTNTGVLEQVV